MLITNPEGLQSLPGFFLPVIPNTKTQSPLLRNSQGAQRPGNATYFLKCSSNKLGLALRASPRLRKLAHGAALALDPPTAAAATFEALPHGFAIQNRVLCRTVICLSEGSRRNPCSPRTRYA
jgi:hypothetical protein